MPTIGWDIRRAGARVARAQHGFTLVELLVVLLILGLLASIAVPSFFSQRHKAQDATAKAAVRTAQTALSTYATDHEGEYTGATASDLVAIERTLAGADLAIASVGQSEYEVTATSDSGNTFTAVRNANGTVDLSCTVPGRAGCPEAGVWG